MSGNISVGEALLSVPVRADASRTAEAHRGLSALIALVILLLAGSSVRAETCITGLPRAPVASAMIGTTIAASSTAFLLQSVAFVNAPGNPGPGQPGGGVWVRGVDGEINVKSSSYSSLVSVPSNAPAGTGRTNSCSQEVREKFAGIQLGADIARLNINGWNFHVGLTVGYLGANAELAGGAYAYTDQITHLPAGGGPFTSPTQVPFFGTYAVATLGGFSIDALLRSESYESSLNSPSGNFFGQAFDAHGISFSSSATYQWQVPKSDWFVEPSAGMIITRVKVDPLNLVSTGTVLGTFDDRQNGTLALNDVKSDIGRAGVRFGTTIDAGGVIWQPFGAVSVWREFGPQITATGQGVFATNLSSTTTFGTFGQYSLGVAAQPGGTGWLGFARVDYRSGSQLQGISATSGVRYQFTPAAAPKLARADGARQHGPPAASAVEWTGFYVGGFGGASLGSADWKYGSGEASPRIGGYNLGGDIGYRYQTGPLVFGVETSIEKTNVGGGTGCGPLANSASAPASSVPMFQMTCNTKNDWLATATAQVGYPWERALFYVKGGGAWTDLQVSATCNTPVGFMFSCTNPELAPSRGLAANTGLTGWLIGCGAEFALTRDWSANAEINYFSFADRAATANDGSILNIGLHFAEAKVGFRYRFNLGSAGGLRAID